MCVLISFVVSQDNMAFQLNMFQQTLQQMSSQLQSVTSDVSNIKKKLDRKRKREKVPILECNSTSNVYFVI